jgi:hypothetical protein
MARQRMIKPEFWASEDIMELSFEERLFYIGFWNFADDSGIHPWKPKSLKAKIFPADNVDCMEIIEKLIQFDLLEEYEVGGSQYLRVVEWNTHQSIKYPTFDFPLPDGTVPEKPRRVKNPPHVPHMSPTCPPDVLPKLNQTKSNQTKPNQDNTRSGEQFDLFWKEYERRGVRKTAKAQWDQLSDRERTDAVDAIEHYRKEQPDKTYRKHAHIYLRDRVFMDILERFDNGCLDIKRNGSNNSPIQNMSNMPGANEYSQDEHVVDGR